MPRTRLGDARLVTPSMIPFTLEGAMGHLTVRGSLLPLLVGAATSLAATPRTAGTSQGSGASPVPCSILATKTPIGAVAGPPSPADPLKARATIHRVAAFAPSVRQVPHELNASRPGAAALASVLLPSAPIARLARRDREAPWRPKTAHLVPHPV